MNPPAKSSATPAPQQPHWALVVDDEESLCQVIVDILALQGVRGVAAQDGDTALRLLEAADTEPLVVFSDVLMPGMDGFTLARKLQSRSKHSTIVLMSGHISDTSWWPADLRSLSFLAKPFHLEGINAIVHAARLNYDRAS